VALGVVVPVVHKVFPLAEAAQAMDYLAEGHSVGKVILKMEH
jgi:NADPH:quinone reductase-like Zn-dependent oxidoreductase